MENTHRLIAANQIVASMEGRMKDLLLTYSEVFTTAIEEASEARGKGLSSFLTFRLMANDALVSYRNKLVKSLEETPLEATPDLQRPLNGSSIEDHEVTSWFCQHSWRSGAELIFLETESLRKKLPEYTTHVNKLLQTANLFSASLKDVTIVEEGIRVVKELVKTPSDIRLDFLNTVSLFPTKAKPFIIGRLVHTDITSARQFHIPTLLVNDLNKPTYTRPLSPVLKTDLPAMNLAMGACQDMNRIFQREWEHKFSKRKSLTEVNPFVKNRDLFFQMQNTPYLSNIEKDMMNLLTDPAYLEQHVLFYLEGIQRYRTLLNLLRKILLLSTRELKS